MESGKFNSTYLPLQRDDSKQIVYDPSTKLQWQDNYEAKSVTRDWKGAKRYCENLSLEGYNDWRLPKIEELLTLTDKSRYNPSIKSGIKNINSTDYWSATPSASDSSYAWSVDFEYGNSYNYNKSDKNYVRCVRAGQ